MSDTDQPDTYSNAWYRQQFEDQKRCYRGASTAVNRCLADNEDLLVEIRKHTERIVSLEEAREADRAAIGELREQIGVMNERLDKAAQAYKLLKNGVSVSPSEKAAVVT